MHAMTGRLQHGAAVDDAHLSAILDFLREFVDNCHHNKEELMLFPLLQDKVIPGIGALLGTLLAEHQHGRQIIAGLAMAVTRYRRDPAAALAIADGFSRYGELLRQHIEREDGELLAIADSALDEDEQHHLLQRFDALEDDVIGPGRHESFHRSLHELRDCYL